MSNQIGRLMAYHEEMHRVLHKESPEACLPVYAQMVDVLRGRGMRNAFDGGELAAVVYISFLKFLSDRKEILGIQCSDNFQYAALCRLYPEVIGQQDILRYLMDVEEQLRLSHGILGGLLFPRQGREFDDTFRAALEVGQFLDFTTDAYMKAHVDALLVFIEKLAASKGKAGGISYTPGVISNLMNGLLQIRDGMSLYDPCAGVGLLLAQVMKGKDIGIFAQEIHNSTAAILEMLLVMNGARHGRISCNDSAWNPLSYEMNMKYDRVICDPPYVKPEAGYRNIINSQLMDHILYYPEEKIEDPWIFVRHIVASLKPDGRAVVILPMSMMTREGAAGRMRQRLIEDGYIDSVIELPPGAYPFTSIKTSILVIERDKPQHDVFFLDLSKGQWDGKSDCDNSYIDMVNEHKEVEGTSALIQCEELMKNGFQLVAGRYIEQPIDMEQFISDSTKLYESARSMEEKFRNLCDDFNAELEEYNGYLNEGGMEDMSERIAMMNLQKMSGCFRGLNSI